MTEWPQVRLRDVASQIKDGTHGTHGRVESGVPFLSAKNVGSNGRLNWSEADDQVSESDYSAITTTFTPRRGDLLLTVVGTIGRSALFDGSRVVFQRSVAFVRCDDRVLPEYLFQASCSESFTRQLERRCNITAQAGLYLGELAKVTVPLPPPKQQQKIAAILTSIDKAIETTEALIEKYQQIKAGLMHDLFTRGVLPNGQLRPPHEQAPELYQETSIGWIPRDWRVDRIEAVLNRIIDYRGKTPEKTVSGIPLITARNVRMGYIESEPREFIAETDYSAWMTRGIPNTGDILFTTEAPLGNVAQVSADDRTAFAQRVIILQPSDQIRATFLAYRLMTEPTQRAISRLASGSTALGIKQSEFRKIWIGFPADKREQGRIELKLDAMDGWLFKQLESKNKLQRQKRGLMQDLLTGKVQVNTTYLESLA